MLKVMVSQFTEEGDIEQSKHQHISDEVPAVDSKLEIHQCNLRDPSPNKRHRHSLSSPEQSDALPECSLATDKEMDEQNRDQVNQMSEYERRRAINIERNNSRLFQLGLLSKEEMERSNDEAWGRCYENNGENGKRKRVRNAKGNFVITTDAIKKIKTDRSSKGNSTKGQMKKISTMATRARKGRAAKLKLAEQNGVWV